MQFRRWAVAAAVMLGTPVWAEEPATSTIQWQHGLSTRSSTTPAQSAETAAEPSPSPVSGPKFQVGLSTRESQDETVSDEAADSSPSTMARPKFQVGLSSRESEDEGGVNEAAEPAPSRWQHGLSSRERDASEP